MQMMASRQITCNLSEQDCTKDNLLAWQNGKTLCSSCCKENKFETYCCDGLSHHYRIAHKSTAYTDCVLKEGTAKLREAAASETLQNLLKLSEQRKQMVSSVYNA